MVAMVTGYININCRYTSVLPW